MQIKSELEYEATMLLIQEMSGAPEDTPEARAYRMASGLGFPGSRIRIDFPRPLRQDHQNGRW